MLNNLPQTFRFSPDVARALASSRPLVALETAVVTHGLPYPQNLDLAHAMENTIRESGATPATIGLVDGFICIGLDDEALNRLATGENFYKVSRRDFSVVIAREACGGTTVAGTLIAAHAAGIRVFATGGIGGVHRGEPFDISTDLVELSRNPLVVVCAGAKAILDLPATLEVLETYGVPVLGYQTDDFPAFYARRSGLRVPVRVDTTAEVAAIARAHWDLGIQSAVLVVVPPPEENAMDEIEMEHAIDLALNAAHDQGISGQAVTPFLLSHMAALTGGASLQANLALLLNNARVAASIAAELTPAPGIAI